MRNDPVTVELDSERQLMFNHTTIVKLDDELDRRYDTNFQSFAMEAAGGFHFGILVASYKWAMRATEGRMDDQKVAQMLDQSDLTMEDLLLNLVKAHPYMRREVEKEEASLSEDGDTGPTLAEDEEETTGT